MSCDVTYGQIKFKDENIWGTVGLTRPLQMLTALISRNYAAQNQFPVIADRTKNYVTHYIGIHEHTLNYF